MVPTKAEAADASVQRMTQCGEKREVEESRSHRQVQLGFFPGYKENFMMDHQEKQQTHLP